MSKNSKLTEEELLDIEKFSDVDESIFILRYIIKLKNKLRELNGGRLGHSAPLKKSQLDTH